MNHTDHVNLLRDGVPTPGGVWADLGSGSGAFTLALAELLGPGGTIYSIDRDQGALRQQEQAMRARFPDVTVYYRTADFRQPLELPPLDGVVMANSLHFVTDKSAVIRLVQGYLQPGGRLLLVEYDVDQGNTWVPYPLSYRTWEKLAAQCGFSHTREIGVRPSRFLREIYSAESW